MEQEDEHMDMESEEVKRHHAKMLEFQSQKMKSIYTIGDDLRAEWIATFRNDEIENAKYFVAVLESRVPLTGIHYLMAEDFAQEHIRRKDAQLSAAPFDPSTSQDMERAQASPIPFEAQTSHTPSETEQDSRDRPPTPPILNDGYANPEEFYKALHEDGVNQRPQHYNEYASVYTPLDILQDYGWDEEWAGHEADLIRAVEKQFKDGKSKESDYRDYFDT